MVDDEDYFSGDEQKSAVSPPSPDRSIRRPAPRPPRPKIFHCPHCERSFDRPSLLGQVGPIPSHFTKSIQLNRAFCVVHVPFSTSLFIRVNDVSVHIKPDNPMLTPGYQYPIYCCVPRFPPYTPLTHDSPSLPTMQRETLLQDFQLVQAHAHM